MLDPAEHSFKKGKVFKKVLKVFSFIHKIISEVSQICTGCVNGRMNPRLSAHIKSPR